MTRCGGKILRFTYLWKDDARIILPDYGTSKDIPYLFSLTYFRVR